LLLIASIGLSQIFKRTYNVLTKYTKRSKIKILNMLDESSIKGEYLTIYKPEIIILPNPQDVDQFAARRFIEQVQLKPRSVLTLPTGSTSEGMYKLLVQACQELKLDLSQLTIFNLDEYWRLPSNHPASYA